MRSRTACYPGPLIYVHARAAARHERVSLRPGHGRENQREGRSRTSPIRSESRSFVVGRKEGRKGGRRSLSFWLSRSSYILVSHSRYGKIPKGFMCALAEAAVRSCLRGELVHFLRNASPRLGSCHERGRGESPQSGEGAEQREHGQSRKHVLGTTIPLLPRDLRSNAKRTQLF